LFPKRLGCKADVIPIVKGTVSGVEARSNESSLLGTLKKLDAGCSSGDEMLLNRCETRLDDGSKPTDGSAA
jgi:hypothetical protein